MALACLALCVAAGAQAPETNSGGEDPGYDTRSRQNGETRMGFPRGIGSGLYSPGSLFVHEETLRRCQRIEAANKHVAELPAAGGDMTQQWVVLDPEGTPIRRVLVKVALANKVGRCHQFQTDEHGRLAFDVLRPKKGYRVEFSAPGYETVQVLLQGGAGPLESASHVVALGRDQSGIRTRLVTVQTDSR